MLQHLVTSAFKHQFTSRLTYLLMNLD